MSLRNSAFYSMRCRPRYRRRPRNHRDCRVTKSQILELNGGGFVKRKPQKILPCHHAPSRLQQRLPIKTQHLGGPRPANHIGLCKSFPCLFKRKLKRLKFKEIFIHTRLWISYPQAKLSTDKSAKIIHSSSLPHPASQAISASP